MKNLLTILMLFLVHFVNGQSATLKGVVTEERGEAIMFATVAIYKNDVLISGTQTNLDGKYQFDSLVIGIYDVEVSYVGYETKKISTVTLLKNKTITLNIEMTQGIEISCPDFFEYHPFLYDADNLTQGTIFFSNEIQRSPHKN